MLNPQLSVKLEEPQITHISIISAVQRHQNISCIVVESRKKKNFIKTSCMSHVCHRTAVSDVNSSLAFMLSTPITPGLDLYPPP